MRKIFNAITPLLALTGLTACESTADIERKPAIADSMIKDSLATCTIGSSTEVYSERLRDILMDVQTDRLNALQSNQVTVCLDKRLSKQTTGWLDKPIQGVLYAGALGGKSGHDRSILSLWDNGTPLKEDGFFSKDASDDGGEIVSKLAKAIIKEGMPKTGEDKIAGEYSYKCGKSTCHEIRWKAAANFDQDTIRKNPDLKSAPTPMQW
ncbi:MAG: hypothetical protein DI586_00510 [Micavibrio aeruginosavorus]|uniref:Lipoprotein n=1 Tax=Micavibrio aeruginosavorus TaxID=349221 RepID=A0A2W5HGS6_9BACT|nr:MAG: hypothetical protein DI586_00510 [Micavibrio aeruginosavorus]